MDWIIRNDHEKLFDALLYPGRGAAPAIARHRHRAKGANSIAVFEKARAINKRIGNC